jgi:hypothetical protein
MYDGTDAMRTVLLGCLVLGWSTLRPPAGTAQVASRGLLLLRRLYLFTCRDLRRWLERPFGTPPLVPWQNSLAWI